MHDNNINIGSLLRNIMRPVRLVNITSFIGIPEPDFLLIIFIHHQVVEKKEEKIITT